MVDFYSGVKSYFNIRFVHLSENKDLLWLTPFFQRRVCLVHETWSLIFSGVGALNRIWGGTHLRWWWWGLGHSHPVYLLFVYRILIYLSEGISTLTVSLDLRVNCVLWNLILQTKPCTLYWYSAKILAYETKITDPMQVWDFKQVKVDSLAYSAFVIVC